ncbi:MAG: endolytic transglycosylase MltG [Steroidobacteraceae bacterium]
MLRRVGLGVLTLVLLAAIGYGTVSWLGQEYRAPGSTQMAIRVQVPPGSTVRGVLKHLAAAGALQHPGLTELYLRLQGKHFKIKAGEYEVPARASAETVVTLLAEGRVVLEQLTVVEGATFADFRRELESDPHVRATLRGASDAAVMAGLGHAGEEPEGRFFPDTYRFASGTTETEILKVAYAKMSAVLARAWAERVPNLPLASPYQALILASIIEKETGLPSERPLIAGVFIERLRKGMRLQSDPTVIYGMGSEYAGTIRTRDLTTDTLYNTYTRAGLPPTPISLPGRESILAAVQPKETGDLYFVATGNGGHHFSATLADHDAAVRHYLTRLREQGLLPDKAASQPGTQEANERRGGGHGSRTRVRIRDERLGTGAQP